MSKEGALALVSNFATEKNIQSAFPKLDRDVVADQLRQRVENPFLINQGTTGTCAPASLIFNLAKTDPENYVSVATSLFTYGLAVLRKWQLKPCHDLRIAPCPARVPQADWLVLASIRDSENWFFDFTSDKSALADGTNSASEIEKWMKAAGFHDIHIDFEEFIIGARGKKAKQLMSAIDLYNKDYQVLWRIDADILDSAVPGKNSTIPGLTNFTSPDHIVSMAGECVMPRNEDSQVSFPVFTWGKKTTIPQVGGLRFGQFLDGFFGYAAAKF